MFETAPISHIGCGLPGRFLAAPLISAETYVPRPLLFYLCSPLFFATQILPRENLHIGILVYIEDTCAYNSMSVLEITRELLLFALETRCTYLKGTAVLPFRSFRYLSGNRPFRYDVNMRDNNSDQNLEVKTNLPRRSNHTLHESYSSDFETLLAKCRMNALTSNLWKVERGIYRNYR